MNRASASIPANIAEGSSRKSQKDQPRFMQIALGSAFELETFCIEISDLNLLDENQNVEDLLI